LDGEDQWPGNEDWWKKNTRKMNEKAQGFQGVRGYGKDKEKGSQGRGADPRLLKGPDPQKTALNVIILGQEKKSQGGRGGLSIKQNGKRETDF